MACPFNLQTCEQTAKKKHFWCNSEDINVEWKLLLNGELYTTHLVLLRQSNVEKFIREWTCSSDEMQEIITGHVRGNREDRGGGNIKMDHKLNRLWGCELNQLSSMMLNLHILLQVSLLCGLDRIITLCFHLLEELIMECAENYVILYKVFS